MNLVLDKEIDQRHERAKEEPTKNFAVFDRNGVWRAQSETAPRPRYSCHKVRDHENIVPIVVIGRGHVCPSSASQGSEEASSSNDGWKVGVGSLGKEIPESNECKSRPRCDGNENHEDRSFRVAVANGRGDRRKPLLWVAVVLILNNLGIMQPASNNQCTEERTICDSSVCP